MKHSASVFLIAVALLLIAPPAHATYAQDATLATNTAFLSQIQGAATKAAIAIAGEAATTHPTLDSKRHDLAVQVLTKWTATLQNLIAWAAIETGLTGTPTDAQVDAAISAAWNAMAGVSVRDSTNLQ